MDDQEARDRVARVETLLEEVEALSDPAGRDKATEIAGALLDVYGECLARIMGQLGNGAAGTTRDALAEDELVSHLLILHELHPRSLDDRVLGALAEVRPYLESHGGNVELLSTDGGVARLRLQGSCSGCPSSTMTLKLAIEDAIRKAAPDLEEIEAEGAVEEEESGGGLLQLTVSESLGGAGSAGAPNGDGAWATAGSLPELSSGGTIVKTVSGEPVLFLRLESNYYAYRPTCPGCEGSLEGASLRLVELTCPGCGNRYDAIRAGRCLDEPRLYMEPVPLLVDDAGLVKVAVGSAVA